MRPLEQASARCIDRRVGKKARRRVGVFCTASRELAGQNALFLSTRCPPCFRLPPRLLRPSGQRAAAAAAKR